MNSSDAISSRVPTPEFQAEILETLCAYAWDAIFVHDFQGRLLFANQTACRSLGYTEDEILQVSAYDIESSVESRDEFQEFWTGLQPGEAETVQGRHRRKDGSTFPVEVRVGLVKIQGESVIFAIARDISKRTEAESLLKAAVEGTVSGTGEDFFLKMVQSLSECLGCRHAFVGEILGAKKLRVRTRAAWMNGEKAENFEYELDGSPCSQVIRHGVCHIPTGVKEAFPDDEALVELGVDSYYGMCLYNSDDEAIGILVILDVQPMERPTLADSMLRIFATRAGSELERLQVEADLQKERAFSENLLESLPGLVYLCDREGHLIRWNKNMELSTGLPADELLGSLVLEWFSGEDHDRLKAAFERVFSIGHAELEVDIYDQQGNGHPHFCTGTRIDWGGRLYLIGVALEISRQKEAEEALRISREKYKSIFMNIQDIYYECALDGTILEISPSVEAISGYTRQELLGKSAQDIYHVPEDRDRFLQLLLERGGVSDYEILMRSKSSDPVPCSVTVTLVRDEAGTPQRIFGVLRDISERKRAEMERNQLEQQLHQAQKMEAVGLLAGGVAHDFNNLLQVILGYTDFALNFIESDNPSREMLEEVRKAGGRAEILIRQLLAFSRRDHLQREYVDLNTIVSGVSKMLRRVIGENINLQFQGPPELPLIHADPGQVEQVLMNLCVNARDAMPRGGDLSISTDLFQADPSFCNRHPGAEHREYLLLTVSDTGEGMSPDIQERVFEPFFTTKKDGAGTGLGLATVYAIVERHQGIIELESSESQGTTFRMYFPTVAAELSESEEVTKTAETCSVGGTILLAEDEEQVRELTHRVLTKAGYKVLAAPDGLEALRLFREYHDRIDLALLDVVMPRMSGQTVCEAIREKRPELPVVFASGYSFDVLESRYNTENMPPLLAKPYTPQELLAQVAQVLDESRNGKS